MAIRLAHLSDLHLNGSADRRGRLVGALARATGAGAQHLILTGDLSARARPEQFRELAGVLLGHWGSTSTIVPGNHDGGSAFDTVFGGIGAPVDLGEALVVPVDTRIPRRALLFRATGAVGRRQLAGIDLVTRNTTRPTIVAMHHGPQAHGIHYLEGLQDRGAMNAMLGRSPLIRVLCGHDHRVLDLGRVHVAASCALHPDPLRLYDVGVGVPDGFRVAYRSAIVGTTGLAGVAH